MRTWLVTGAGGALGRDLVELLERSGEIVVAFDRNELDVTSPVAIDREFAAASPDIVINAAAYTRVDDAESEVEIANEVNGHAPGILASASATVGARLIHVSTDYVFPGDADSPYDVDAATGPRSVYGASKLTGETAALAAMTNGGDIHVVRTAWLYSGTGPSFVRAVGARLRRGEPVDVVTDQRGAPTWTRHLAERLIALGSADVAPGVWHCSAGGDASWFDVAIAIAEEIGAEGALVRPTTTAVLNRPAPRPEYSVLSNRKWTASGLPAIPNWRDALHEAFTSIGEALID